MKIDVFTHVLPVRYREALHQEIGDGFFKRLHNATPALFDLDARFSAMDRCQGLRQVLTIAAPPIENTGRPEKAREFARMANDGMADLVARYPDRFVSAVACLPMSDIDAALEEAERATRDLHCCGVEVFTPVGDRPLDSPEFFDLYRKMAEYDLPVWIHPERPLGYADYRSEKRSRYRMHVAFGWIYETTTAMARLVLGGVLEKYPDLKFITHHAGGMVPFFEKRIVYSIERADQQEDDRFKDRLTRPLTDYFKLFYCDTALYGSTAGLMCAHAFFGTEHLLFGSDSPFGGDDGYVYASEAVRSVEGMAISEEEKQMVFEGNARRLLKLRV